MKVIYEIRGVEHEIKIAPSFFVRGKFDTSKFRVLTRDSSKPRDIGVWSDPKNPDDDMIFETYRDAEKAVIKYVNTLLENKMIESFKVS